MKNNILLILFLFVCIGLIFSIRGCSKATSENRENLNLIQAYQDTLQIIRNADSSITARIQSFETDSKTLKKLKSQDSAIKALQKIVDNKTTGAVVFKANTKTEVTTKTQIVYKDSFPEYSSNINMNGWITGKIIANKDSIITNLLIKNDYSVSLKKDRNKSYVEIISLNPYSDINNVRSYIQIKEKPKRIGLGVHIGYGAFIQNEVIKTTPFIGIGLNYNLINIK